MTTYSLRCRNSACRHRRVASIHPNEYKVVPRCTRCGERCGWRIEDRAYNRRGLCHCSGPEMVTGRHFPHRPHHPLCDNHPHGFYNQARARGVAPEEIPYEYRPKL
jgi:hypothetical protein